MQLEGMTRDELRAEAARLEIPGRGRMTKAQLVEAIADRQPEPMIEYDLTEPEVHPQISAAKAAAARAMENIKQNQRAHKTNKVNRRRNKNKASRRARRKNR